MASEHLSLSIPQRPDPASFYEDPAKARADFFFELEFQEVCRIIPQASIQETASAADTHVKQSLNA